MHRWTRLGGSGEQETLYPMAVELGERIALCFPFDALGDDGMPWDGQLRGLRL
jgi:hypothetical protein